MSYAMDYPIAARAHSEVRAAFMRRTYGHLAGAVLAFVGLETLLLQIPGVSEAVLGMGRAGWIIVLLVFIGAGWLARMWAHSDASPALQYLGLGLYVAVEAVVFLPLIWFAVNRTGDPYLIPMAGIMTLAIFGGLTMSVFITRRDYSFLGPILSIGCFIALGVAIAGMLFGFTMPLFYSFAMVALASGFIIYDTSNVLHHYRTDQHVGAALELFASLALLFYYILRIALALSDRR
jgi:FtsH-binding integral membrane protein